MNLAYHRLAFRMARLDEDRATWVYHSNADNMTINHDSDIVNEKPERGVAGSNAGID